ncbi:MAG: hypothetical protein U0U67_06610 [Chitinophagales bacterium]
MSKCEKNKTIQTAVLWEICNALKHNFFLDLAAALPSIFTTNVPVDTTKDERITQLEKEIDLLKAKNEALMEA